MKNKMLWPLLAMGLALSVIPAAAQPHPQAMMAAGTAPAAPARIVTEDDRKAAVKGATPDINLFAKTLSAASAAGMHISVDIIRRLKPEGRGLIHDRVTEIYQVEDGSGMLLTGGQLFNMVPIPPGPDTGTIGPSRQSPDLRGGVKKPVGPGDLVVIPAGTPHEFLSIAGHITYLVIRLDPSH